QVQQGENCFVDLGSINLHFVSLHVSHSFLRVLVQPGLEALLQPQALVSPLPVKGAEVKPPILLVISPRAVVGKEIADIPLEEAYAKLKSLAGAARLLRQRHAAPGAGAAPRRVAAPFDS